MKTLSPIVAGGGWVTRQSVGRPKARLFGLLSLFWLPVCLCVSLAFWVALPDALPGLVVVCSLLMAPEAVFVVLAVMFSLTEQPRTIVEKLPNPDYDIRNLY